MAYSRKPSLIAETPLGPMTAHFNSGTNIVFNQERDQALTINRVAYHVHFGARLTDAGWNIDTYSDNGGRAQRSTLGLNRVVSYKCFDYSQAAWDKGHAVLSAWLPTFAAAHAAELAEAARLTATEEREAAESKVARLRAELAEAAESLNAAVARLAALPAA